MIVSDLVLWLSRQDPGEEVYYRRISSGQVCLTIYVVEDQDPNLSEEIEDEDNVPIHDEP